MCSGYIFVRKAIHGAVLRLTGILLWNNAPHGNRGNRHIDIHIFLRGIEKREVFLVLGIDDGPPLLLRIVGVESIILLHGFHGRKDDAQLFLPRVVEDIALSEFGILFHRDIRGEISRESVGEFCLRRFGRRLRRSIGILRGDSGHDVRRFGKVFPGKFDRHEEDDSDHNGCEDDKEDLQSFVLHDDIVFGLEHKDCVSGRSLPTGRQALLEGCVR